MPLFASHQLCSACREFFYFLFFCCLDACSSNLFGKQNVLKNVRGNHPHKLLIFFKLNFEKAVNSTKMLRFTYNYRESQGKLTYIFWITALQNGSR